MEPDSPSDEGGDEGEEEVGFGVGTGLAVTATRMVNWGE